MTAKNIEQVLKNEIAVHEKILDDILGKVVKKRELKDVRIKYGFINGLKYFLDLIGKMKKAEKD